ncbi:MAG: plasmid stabilization protein [Bacteroidia bacterium]
MIVIAAKSFNKDISKIRDKKVAVKIEEIIIQLEKAKSIAELPNVKKMEGASIPYRIRIEDYRLGFYLIDHTVQLIVFAHRKDICKLFP